MHQDEPDHSAGDAAGPAGGLLEGMRRFNAGHFWAAHEAWESIWITDRQGADAKFWKGMIQIAAGCLHAGRRNRRGALNKWRGGLALIDGYRPVHQGLELESLVDWVLVAVRTLEASPVEWPELPLGPRLMLVSGST